MCSAEHESESARIAYVDQSHAMLRDYAAHLRGHCRDALAAGGQPNNVALQMASELAHSPHTRETMACLLGIALTDLAIAQEWRRR